ncbi:hypothetical protein G6F43_013634 [Rhizopus delemar]|nr:hypothetical protein G6F43_013634 [Rhizopus delemar]
MVKFLTYLKDLIVQTFEGIDTLASKFKFIGGVFFIAAFSGLLSPYWRDDARGRLVGLIQSTDKPHITRATLKAICFSTRTILKSMNMVRSVSLKALKVDDGMSNPDQCMQIQFDVLGIPVSRLDMCNTSALGVPFAAGLAPDIWKDIDMGW